MKRYHALILLAIVLAAAAGIITIAGRRAEQAQARADRAEQLLSLEYASRQTAGEIQ